MKTKLISTNVPEYIKTKVRTFSHLKDKWGNIPTINAMNYTKLEVDNYMNASDRVYAPIHMDINYIDADEYRDFTCQLRCVYCQTRAGSFDRFGIEGNSAFSTKEIINIMEQYAELGGKTVLLSNDGEPLRNPQRFLAMASAAKGLGLRASTHSNIVDVTPALAKQLFSNDVSVIAKLEHLDPIQNSIITGAGNRYEYVEYEGEKIPKQLVHLLDAGYKDSGGLAVSSIINKKNSDNLLSMSSWAYEMIGSAHFRKSFSSIGFAEKNAKLIDLSQSQKDLFVSDLYNHDLKYGFSYPGRDTPDMYSYDIRRFLNNYINKEGMAVRMYSHPLGGFYTSYGGIVPKFDYNEGVRIGMRDTTSGKINLTNYYSTILRYIREAKQEQEAGDE
jgi:MoaA/NifB/PqqE/SkfB family radical SAM enzyme